MIISFITGAGGGSGSGVTPSEVNTLINSAITQGEYINNAEYISSAKTIVLYQDSTEVATIDATAFIKDGMVDSVTVSGSILTIVFNTDAGKEPINVDLSDVVDLSDYYTKTDVDAIASGKVDTSALSAYTLQSDFAAHSGNTGIHTTLAEKAVWNGKQDALRFYTEDSDGQAMVMVGDGYVEVYDNYVHLGTDDLEVMVSDGAVTINDDPVVTASQLNDYYTSAQTESAISGAVLTKQDTLISGTNIKTINSQSLLGSGNIDIQGGGATYSAGTNISIDTANTISCTLPITAGTYGTSVAIGLRSQALNGASLAVGQDSQTNGGASAAIGDHCQTKNTGEFACGFYNTSITGTSNTNRTLFSVGNGTADNARKNALEIRQNGDIYITSGGTDIKLQDNLGGGSGSYVYYSEDTEAKSANIHIEDTENGTTGEVYVDGASVDIYASRTEEDEDNGSMVETHSDINGNNAGIAMSYEKIVDGEEATHSYLNVSEGNISLEIMSNDWEDTNTLAVSNSAVTINNERVVTEAAFQYDPITSALTITFLNA